MDRILASPAVQTMLVVLVLTIGGYLIKLFTDLTAKVGQTVEHTKTVMTQLDAVATTTGKTEVLVNSQRAEMVEEIKAIRVQLDEAQRTIQAMLQEKIDSIAAKLPSEEKGP